MNRPPRSEDGISCTLPTWIYNDYEFFKLEAQQLFGSAWQLAGHINEIPNPGDFITLDVLNARALVLRDTDGEPRAFHNVCSHRAHALVEGHRGSCPGFLTCPYHGWTFHLDGRNRAVNSPKSLNKLDRTPLGLKPIDIEVFMGFVFLRLQPDGASIAERWAPWVDELARYRLEEMQPLHELREQTHNIDWKTTLESCLQDCHSPTGHRDRSALMEQDYEREVTPHGALRISHRMLDEPRRNWSARHYAHILPRFQHLPRGLNRRWSFFGLFPQVLLKVFPDHMETIQMIPVGPGKTRLRAQAYGLPDNSRDAKAARFLSRRINIRVQNEDNALTGSAQQGLASQGHPSDVPADQVVILKGFFDWLQARIPAAQLPEAPRPGSLAAINETITAAATRPR